MKNKIYRSALSAILFALVASAARAQEPAETRDKELPNFHEVSASLFRGGQPGPGGLRKLAARGVKTVINLRGDDKLMIDEEREVKSLGMRYFNLPLSLGGRPTRGQIARALALIDAPENQPVFVHCRKGADRTGVVVAAYRITHDHWTGEEAQREADKYGMGWWQRGKKDFIRDYFRDGGGAAAREGVGADAHRNSNANRKAERGAAKPAANRNAGARRGKPASKN
ncbi:MAG: tyrosine-protein phosphatase [Acidobacteria bacterium]|nr:tyrosine-protein phosphatase [Acidobacteriota bacterium]MCA1642357.1 tyrosine-protein phosphatase [Acidobacteriota bacterium]